jgi:hypothetical protein
MPTRVQASAIPDPDESPPGPARRRQPVEADANAGIAVA